MEELFDILDENGKKTFKVKERSKVHRDGDWHKAVHIWIVNDKGELLLQRRSPNKDSDPNMLDISCAGHLSHGDDSITGALRELKEELDLDVDRNDLRYITTLKRSPYHDDGFVDNEFDDMYILYTTKLISDMNIQKEELSEILYVSYDKFKDMVRDRKEDLVIYEDEYKVLFEVLDEFFTNGFDKEK